VEIEENLGSYDKVKILNGEIVVPEIKTPPNEEVKFELKQP
jgi:hypothetical protein